MAAARGSGVGRMEDDVGVSNSNQLDVSRLAPRWQFVNLFNHFREGNFYCRLRLIEPEKSQNDWKELTASGATMQIAFDNANHEAMSNA